MNIFCWPGTSLLTTDDDIEHDQTVKLTAVPQVTVKKRSPPMAVEFASVGQCFGQRCGQDKVNIITSLFPNKGGFQ